MELFLGLYGTLRSWKISGEILKQLLVKLYNFENVFLLIDFFRFDSWQIFSSITGQPYNFPWKSGLKKNYYPFGT